MWRALSAPALNESVTIRPENPSEWRSAFTAADEIPAGSVVSPGIEALDIITAVAPAPIERRNGTRPVDCRTVQDLVLAGATSVLTFDPPSPGKCFTTAVTPASLSPTMNAVPSAAATVGEPLKER